MTDVLATPMAHALGLALVHFVWQGAVIGMLTGLLLLVARRASPNTRYLIAAIGLVALAAMPLVTVVAVRSAQAPEATLTLADGRQLLLGGNPVILADTIEITSPPMTLAALEAYLPWVVLTWSAGVLLLTIRLARGWVDVQRIRRRAVPSIPPAVKTTMMRVAVALGVTRRLQLAESSMVEVPTVIGWIRPVILVPASALTGLTPSQMEAIIAHEVAHIRRHDYLINSLQNVVETVLFYHPAVWWVSKQMRLEREHCCDDLAVGLVGDRVVYAGALASLEESRQKTLAFGVAATGGDLLARVRRVLGAPARDRRPSLAMAVSVVVVVTSAAAAAVASGGRTHEPSVTARAHSLAEPQTARLRTGPTEVRPDTLTAAPRPALGVAPARPVAPRPQPQQVVPATTWEVEIRELEERFRVAKLQNDVGTLALILDDDFSETNQNGNTRNKAQFIELFTTFPIKSIVQSGFTVQTTFERAVVSGSMIENNAGVDSMLFTRVWVRAANTWRLLSSTQFRDPRRRPVPTLVGSGATGDVTAATPPLPPPPPPPPGSAARSAVPIRVGGNVQEPTKIRDVKPVYPQEARDAGIQGLVILAATLDESGAVVDARVLRGVASALDEAAVGAVRQWRYTPTIIDGVPASAMITVTINFQLN